MENQPFSNSLMVQENLFLIDWLTVTFKADTVISVIAMLGLDSEHFTEKQSFKNGYPLDTFFSNIHIWSGAEDPRYYTAGYNKAGRWVTAEEKARNDMGVCLNLSGQGCRAFEEHSKVGWFELFKRILQHNGHITRLDLAYDDHMGVIDIYRFAHDIHDRNYRSKSKKSKILWSDDQEQDVQGLTVYVGKESSDVFIRVYDKAAERGFDHSKHWVRVELQLRDERADAALRRLFQKESIGVVAAGILRNYLTVCVPTGDSNKARWPVAYYWERVLGQMETIRLWSAPGEPYNFSKTEMHVIKQYAQFVLAYKDIYGSMQNLWLECQHYQGTRPLKPKYVNAINEHLCRQSRGKPMPPMSDGCNAVGLQYTNETFNILYDDDDDLALVFGGGS